uniref:Uncharacterized protein n=1 Tax=Arundo donax TaxID=35708 RepID=A0A0A9CGI3_ARUDO
MPAVVPRRLTSEPGTLNGDQQQRQGLRFRRGICRSGQQALGYGSAGMAVPQPPMATPEPMALGNGKARPEKCVRLFGVDLVVPNPGSAA